MPSYFDEFRRKTDSTSTTKPAPTSGTTTQTATQTQQPQPSPTPTQAPTFAQLQQQGYARPAPPTMTWDANPARMAQPPQTGGLTPSRPPTYGTSPIPQQSNMNLSGLLTQQLGYGLQNPSAYNADVVMDAYNRLDRRMADQFDLDRQYINEDAARRGINFSTIPIGRLGDVAIRQGQARSDLASSLMQDQARTYGQDRASIIGQAMGYGQNAFQNQLDTARFNSDQDFQNMQLMLALLGYT